MKKQIFLGAALLLLMASCSNNDTTNEDEKGKVDVVQAVNFTVDFADYNAEQEVGVTRAAEANKEEKLEQQAIDLGNGILAMCTLQRDNTKQEKPAATRALPNDTYTMLAYDAATKAFKGEMTGTVSGGAFIAAHANNSIQLTPGTYDFVLFNSKVSRSGNNLTVNRADAGAAMIGRTENVTITPTPGQQQVAFTLKHAGAKVSLKLTSYVPFSGPSATLASVNATDVPGSSVYDAATGTWTAGGGAALSVNTTYPSSRSIAGGKYVANSKEEILFIPTTDVSKLKLTFTGGSIYRKNIANVGLTFSPATPLTLEQNGAYVLNVEMKYNFFYLMSNGDVGTIKETIYGGAPAATAKTPIAVVLSRTKKMAAALNNTTSGFVQDNWSTSKYMNKKTNTYTANNMNAPLTTQPTSGLEETWNPNYSTSVVTGNKVKGLNPDFLAFYAAAHYDPGVAYTGATPLKWYLPSHDDWKWFFSALGLGDKTIVTKAVVKEYDWYGELAEAAFMQVNGTTILGKNFWSSSAYDYQVGFVHISVGNYLKMTWKFTGPNAYALVRPFVKY